MGSTMLARRVQRCSLVDGGSSPGTMKGPMVPPSNRMVRCGREVALRQRGGEQRDADAGEHDLPVLQQPRGHHGQQLGGGVGGGAGPDA